METNKEDFKLIFDKDNLTIHTKPKGTIFSDQFFLILTEYKAKKEMFKSKISLEQIGQLISDPIKRKKWDDGVNKYSEIEQDHKGSIIHIWLKSPVPFIAERDSVEKTITFIHNNTYYFFLSSTNEDIIPIPEKVERMNDFICIHSITVHDDYVYFRCIEQCDIKTVVPQMLVNITLPLTLGKWYKKYCETYNEEYSFAPGLKSPTNGSDQQLPLIENKPSE